jgi:serine/threonine protein kinase
MTENYLKNYLTEPQRIWLEAIYSKFKKEEPPSARALSVELRDKLPKDFDPEKINTHLLRSGIDITILGIALLDLDSEIVRRTDRIIRDIQKRLLSNPDIKGISATEISQSTEIPEYDVAVILEMLSFTSLFHGSGTRYGPKGWATFNIEDRAFKQYFKYEGMEQLLESFLDVVGSSEIVPGEAETLFKPIPPGNSNAQPDNFKSGRVIGNRYQIIQQLGKGGMGTVYQAIDQRLNRTVALKEIVTPSVEVKRAFEREAELLANLHHPALPSIIDHLIEDDHHFIIMQFIPGDDLAETLSRRGSAFTVDEVLKWADDLLDVLDYLHSYNPPIVHRDIKPSNLKVTTRGQIILLDFGLSKGAAGQMPTVVTSESVRGFTRPYASLEQIQGTSTDPRSDLYSFGATMYHLMTGNQPSSAADRCEAIEAGELDPVKSAHEVNPAVSIQVSRILSAAMAIKRSERPTSAINLRDALRKVTQAPLIKNETEGSTINLPAQPTRSSDSQAAFDRVMSIDRELNYKDKRNKFRSGDQGVTTAQQEVKRLHDELQRLAILANAKSSNIGIQSRCDGHTECVLYYGVSLLSTVWILITVYD